MERDLKPFTRIEIKRLLGRRGGNRMAPGVCWLLGKHEGLSSNLMLPH